MKKILIADDEEILRMLIADSLEDLAVTVDEAVDGQEAYTKILTEAYDLVILDYMMPELSGREILQKLSSEQKSSTTILMLTAKAQKEDQETLLAEGADRFMAKPFSPSELVRLVEDLLNE